MTTRPDIKIFTYTSEHAGTLHGLIERAFSIVPSHARPKDSSEYLNYMQGPANPAGTAIVATANLGGVCVGNISATPFRFRSRAGRELCAYQLGSVVVDAAFQHRGIGSSLVAAITEHLAAVPESFTYIYPNPRSHTVLLRSGYAAASTVPTYVHFPAPRSFARSTKEVKLHDRATGGWRVSRCHHAEIMAVIGDWPADAGPDTGFARDPAFFSWRFGGPGMEQRYRFALCREDGGTETFGAVYASHFFNGIKFVILVDVLSRTPVKHYGIALKAAQIIGSAASERFVYVNSNIPKSEAASRIFCPWGFAVPDVLNPRPLHLLFYPRRDIDLGTEIDASIAMTGDWMGF